jgi:hypothetical protein
MMKLKEDKLDVACGTNVDDDRNAKVLVQESLMERENFRDLSLYRSDR